jgi:hypothetical protein
MKLAFFTSIVPDGNPSTGFEIANEAILAGLRDLGNDVVVFGFQLPRQSVVPDTDVIVLDDRELENVAVGPSQKLRWMLWAMVSRLPFAAAKLVNFSTATLDERIAACGPFDGYVLNSYQMAAAFPQLEKLPYIYVAHNVEHRSAAQNAEAAHSAVQRYLYRRDAGLLRSLEQRLCTGANYVWTFSNGDLAGHGVMPANGCVLPLHVPESPQSGSKEGKVHDVGLIGTWSWQSNLIGLNWFVDAVVPLLPKTLNIAVAGSVPSGAYLQNSSISFLGRVENASAFLQSARVVALISRGGTGVQLKTIESFQAGHACVATDSSLRGIDHLPDNCLQANEPEKFAASIVDLVARQKSGLLPTVDAKQFLQWQKTNLADGLSRGLASLT